MHQTAFERVRGSVPWGIILILSLACLTLRAAPARVGDGDESYFRAEVAPLLEARCLACHHAGQAKGKLSLSTRNDLMRGGEHGPAVVPANADGSVLIARVTPHGGDKPQMPKKGEALSTADVNILRAWITAGAPWPEGVTLRDVSRADRSWWALQPLRNDAAPQLKDMPARWRPNPIDAFVLQALQKKGLGPNPPADARSLIRRMTHDLTGLPPTPEEVAAFASEYALNEEAAVAALADRLLASPHYGERWGRHWLDVVRFGESTGFERNVVVENAWPFRDYVIRSFNDDKPFDRLILEHLAGDVIGKGDPAVEVGTAFLVCGAYDNVGNQDPVAAAQIRADTLDEIIRATSEAFLGMTVGCARCHDHKFDPISAKDYYALYADLSGVTHGAREIATADERRTHEEKIAPLHAQRESFRAERAEVLRRVDERAAAKSADIEAQWTRPPVDRYRTEEKFAPVEAKYVRLSVDNREDQPGQIAGFKIDEFEVWSDGADSQNVALASAGASAAGDSRDAKDFASAYRADLAIDGKIDTRWIAAGPDLTITLKSPTRIRRIVFSSDRGRTLEPHAGETLFVGDYRLLVSPDGQAWQEIASSRDRQPPSAEHRKRRLASAVMLAEEKEKLAVIDQSLAAVERQLAAISPLPTWWVGEFHPAEGPFNVFVGGDPQKKGASVSPSSPAFASSSAAFELPANSPESDRRLALARWIASRDNPLTPRVLANRIWHYHFGTGIVDTPSDFGYMGGRPSHPELLDWLAQELLRNNWRLKPLHRLIVTSQTYRQSGQLRDEAAKIDADSRLLWRYPPRRLDAEEVRDAMLQVAGQLDTRMGGPGFRLYDYQEDNVATYVPLNTAGPETYRRSIYHQNARASRVDLLGDFDCPDNAFPAPRRASTTTPLQALALMNHRFSLDMAELFAKRVEANAAQGNGEQQVRCAYQLAYLREPDAQDLQAAVEFSSAHGLRAFCRVLLNSNEFIYLN